MKIFLDNIVFDLQKAGGISVYWYELINRFNLSTHDVTFIEQDNDISNIFRKQLDINSSSILYQHSMPIRISRYLSVRLNFNTPSIFHSSYYRSCNNSKAVNVVTVYDFIYELFESGLRQKVHMWQKKHALNNANAIICISESTKTDLFKFYPHVSPEKVRVSHIAAGNDFYPLDKKLFLPHPYEHILSKKYILYVGSRQSYKNFDLAIDVVSNLDDYLLVIVGGGELSASDRRKLSSISARFSHIESPSSKDLNLLYNYAYCLLYPSSYERFGIPIVEAMKAGCPVITSSVSSIPEVAGNAALMVDTICSSEIIAKINDLNNESFRNAIIDRGLIQGNKFSWDRCFRETIESYKHAFNHKFSRL